MSLTVDGNSTTTIAPIPEGTYLAVCNTLIDLGVQFNEAYKNSSKKVLIGWEIPEETFTTSDGKELPKTLTKRYTASLNDKSNLRKDLAAWRGRDFTEEELKAFDLRNIIGKSCLINVIHRDSGDKTYPQVASIMALPKGMKPGKLSTDPLIFDLDKDELNLIEFLPEWIQKIIKNSTTYQEKTLVPPEVNELPADDEEAPF